MKIDQTKTKKYVTEVPSDCRALIERLQKSNDEEMLEILAQTKTWPVGKCELYHWIEVLNRFDLILEMASRGEKWSLRVNTDEYLQELTLGVLQFTSLLIEYSFSRHLYNSVEYLVSLLSSSNLDIVLAVLNLLYVFSKRSNFLARLSEKQRNPLLRKLEYLAENWGGKEKGFSLADAAKNLPKSSYPHSATTLHYEFYSEQTGEEKSTNFHSTVHTIHIENVDQLELSPPEIMQSLLDKYPIPVAKQMLLFTHLRLAHNFADRNKRLKCIQARLHAISVLVYMNNFADNLSSIIYSGFIEELVDLLQVTDSAIVDIKAAALRTLTSMVHLDVRDRTPRVVEATGVSQYHGFLPVLVRRCIQWMTGNNSQDSDEFSQNFSTALFSFLYHLASYEIGAVALTQSGFIRPLLNVIVTMGDHQEHTTFVTRAVRLIDLITNAEWQTFQRLNGLTIFINRFEREVKLCNEKEANADGTFAKGKQCLPQRAALFKSVLNFLKKAISDHVFGDDIRHMMDGSLPQSLKHIIKNVDYYGPSLFLLAIEVVTVYVFQEPSLLSLLQDNGVTEAVLEALLVKDPPATREVLASLPNIFSALCLNSRGLDAFVKCDPFKHLFQVMLNPNYLVAMRRRRSSGPLDRDTASNLGNAMDELMRHQPSLRPTAMLAIIQLLSDLHDLGSNPSTVCSKVSSSKTDVSSSETSVGVESVFDVVDTESDDEKSVEEETPPTSEKPSIAAAEVTSSGAKKQVPLLEYILNAVKFIQAIISNNATDDHCREFQQKGGLPKLFALLRMPALPLDFPTSTACQAIANLVKSILTLSKQPAVFSVGLKDFQAILVTLEPIYVKTGEEGDKYLNSYLLQALSRSKTSGDVMEMEVVKSLSHAHAFVNTLLQLSRTLQGEVRNLLIREWASEIGLDVLDRMNKLYCSLIWESTMLLKLCSANPVDKNLTAVLDNMFTIYYPKSDKSPGTSGTDSAPGTDTESATVSKIASQIVTNTYMNSIRPILTASSRLGRSLAELFGLLIKLSVGLPPRQRYRNVPNTHAQPSKEACLVAERLSQLLNMGLSWVPDDQPHLHKPRITFLLCTIGFTMGMLLDERQASYHLMLRYFESSGAHAAFFQCFTWALSIRSNGDDEDENPLNQLPGNLDSLFETWLSLLQNLVNPKNILDSPHIIPDNRPSTEKKFRPAHFLLKTHKAALQALQQLWVGDKLKKLTDTMFDSLMTIMCHLIQGEKLISERLKKEKATLQTSSATTAAPTATSTTSRIVPATASRSSAAEGRMFVRLLNAASNLQEEEEDVINQDHLDQLTDMGFSANLARQALTQTQSLEAATEWLLTHSVPDEEDQLMRAISLSLSLGTTTDPVATTTASTASQNQTTQGVAETMVTTSTQQTDSTQSSVSTVQSSDANTQEVVAMETVEEEVVPMETTQADKQEEEKKEVQPPKQDEDEDYSSYMDGTVLDEFTSTLSDGCLQLLDHFPGKVHRVCDLVEAIMRRNKDEWRDTFIKSVITEISDSCNQLRESYNSTSKVHPHEDSNNLSMKLLTRCVLLSLLFESRLLSELCRSLVKESGVIDSLLQLLEGVSKVWSTQDTLGQTQEWVSCILVLVDIYQRACIRKIRMDNLSHMSGREYEWKWFDERWGRWSAYNAAERKIIDKAYRNNAADVRFTSGRRRYHIFFNEMTQVNEETGGKKMVIMMYKKRTKNQSVKKDSNDMETDPSQLSQLQEVGVVSEANAYSLVKICTQLISTEITKDTLQAAMRMLLRLTRSDMHKGYERAILFVESGGPASLLQLKKKNGFDGFASFATLLLSQIFEDRQMLRQVMEKAIRNIPLLNSPRMSYWRREMNHFLLMMAPMTCRNPRMFADVIKNHTRIMLPSTKLPRVEEEERKLVSSNGVQLLQVKPDTPGQSGQAKNVSKSIPLNDTAKQLLDLLLNALVTTSQAAEKHEKDKESEVMVSDFASGLRDAGDRIHKQYDAEEPPQATQIPESSKKKSDDKKKKDDKPQEDLEAQLIDRTFVLRLLTELVTSYPACVVYIASYVYAPAFINEKNPQSCVVYILRNILPPATDKTKNTSAKNNKITPAEKIQNENADLARMLLTSMVCSHYRPKVNNGIFTEIRSSLRHSMTMHESTAKHLMLRALLKLVNNILVGSTKQTHALESGDKVGEKWVSIPQMMINKGLPTEIAFIPNFIDLGSPNMTETINAVLEPLAFLSRQVLVNVTRNAQANQKTEEKIPAPSSGNGISSETTQENSEPNSDTPPTGNERIYSLRMSPYESQDIDDDVETPEPVQGAIDSLDDLQFHDPGSIDLQEEEEDDDDDGSDHFGGSEDEELEVDNENEEESERFGESEEDEFDDDERCHSEEAATLVFGDERDSSEGESESQSDNEEDEDDNEEDDDDDDDDQIMPFSMEDVQDAQVHHRFDPSGDYDNQLVDVLLNEVWEGNMGDRDEFERYLYSDRTDATLQPLSTTVLSSSFDRTQSPHVFEFHDEPSSAGRNSSLYNSSLWFVPDRHPLLRRQGTVVAQRHTTTRPSTQRTQTATTSTNPNQPHTLQIEFRTSDISNEASDFLHRLLGPSVSADVLQLTNQLYRHGGGHAQVFINTNNLNEHSSTGHHALTDTNRSTDNNAMVMPSMQRFGVHMPPVLLRWSQASAILEQDSIMLCATSVRDEIVEHLENERDVELEERKKKREQEKKEELAKKKKQKEEEEAKKKAEEESKKDNKETTPQDGDEGSSVDVKVDNQEEPMTVSPVQEEDITDAVPILPQEDSNEQPPAEEMQQTSDTAVPEQMSQCTEPTTNQESSEAQTPVTQAGGAATSESTDATGASADASFGGVDPSFLAALPDDIRQEVIREQLSHSTQASTSEQPSEDSNTISAEFLAALPPSIQQEVLAQQRAEQARRTRAATTTSSANEPVDPTTFIQTLPSHLRQSVLSDIDDSLLAMLPSEIAQEAQNLRYNLMNQPNLQNLFMSRRPLGQRQSYVSSHMPQISNRPFDRGLWMPGVAGERSKMTGEAAQLLSRKALVCLLMLLFIDGPKLQLTKLCKILRNLSWHEATLSWLVHTLVDILHHSAESSGHLGAAEGKQIAVKHSEAVRHNMSWRSIRLDSALGSRVNIFNVEEKFDELKSVKTKVRRKSNRDASTITLRSQAAPVVCKNIINILTVIAKSFPSHFTRLEGRNRTKHSDFWTTLLKLDAMQLSDIKSERRLSGIEGDKKSDASKSDSGDSHTVSIGEMVLLLGHPVIQQSQQLTDKLLTLLAQISSHLPMKSKPPSEVSKEEDQSQDAGGSKDDAASGESQQRTNSSGDESGAATMGAQAQTSNTSTTRHALMNTLTSTTDSGQNLGSKSSAAISLQTLSSSQPLETELQLVVNILTSHACTEAGLEDATDLLINISRSQPHLRMVIVKHLLKGAKELGENLGKQISEFSAEISSYNERQKDVAEEDKPEPSKKKTLSTVRDPTMHRPVNKDTSLDASRELQLPMMRHLTSKTSNQAFFLRLLKVIVLLQNTHDKKMLKKRSARNRVGGNRQQNEWNERLQRNLEAMLFQSDDTRPLSSRSSRTTTSTSNQSVASTVDSEAPPPEEESFSLSELLDLDPLWEVLSYCLVQLESSHDQHAVLVLQPTVEAFFMVHATKPKPKQSKKENLESQLDHLDKSPLSPVPSDTSSAISSKPSTSQDNLSEDGKKFVNFADKHRGILNQILRQSTVPLSEGPFSVLVDYTKVLDFDVKRQHFRRELDAVESRLTMSRRDDIAIRVRRQHVFEDSFRDLHRRTPEELKSRLYIVFEGEEGQDAGGLLREWYLIISREIFNPMYALFRISPGDRVTYTINPLSYINPDHLSYFKFVGNVVAKAIYDNKLLDCYFTRSFYKHILGKAVRYTDMESEDYTFSQSLKFLLENDVSLLGYELNFSVEVEVFGKMEVHDLKPNGRNIPVTEENKREYVHLVCREKMTAAITKQISAFLEGFYEIIPKRLISIFDEQELELLISGLPNVDIEDLRANTEYHKYQTSSLQIQWFWRALKSFDQAERAKFLQFVTGTSKVPLQGFATLEGMTGPQKFQIHRDSRSTSRLPCAHTCFNQLDLPAYETYDKLRHMLMLAISECSQGFGLA